MGWWDRARLRDEGERIREEGGEEGEGEEEEGTRGGETVRERLGEGSEVRECSSARAEPFRQTTGWRIAHSHPRGIGWRIRAGRRRTTASGSLTPKHARRTASGLPAILSAKASTTLNSQQLWLTALEATQGQMDGFFSQLPYKCHLEEVASVGD